MSKNIIENKWNDVFVQFLDEFNKIFPSSSAKNVKTKFLLSKNYLGRKPIDIFLENMEEHSVAIENEDTEYFFENPNIEFVKTLELDKYYKASSKDNRKIIWEYIKILYLLSKGYKERK